MKFGKFSLKTISKKGVVFGLSAGVALGVTGAAFAYWSSIGSGTGSAATGTPAAGPTITQTGTVTGLAPGVAASAITATLTNSSAQAEYVASITVAIGTVTKASGAPSGTCDASDYSLSTPTMTYGHEVPSLGTVPFTGATIGFNDSPTVNQDACQGATVGLIFSSN